MKNRFYIIVSALSILTFSNSQLTLSQNIIDSEVYEVIQNELQSLQLYELAAVIDQPYIEFKLIPSPPPDYKGFDTTLINYLVLRSNIDISEVNHLKDQVESSKHFQWESEKLNFKTITLARFDSLFNCCKLESGYIKMSVPIFSKDKRTMIVVYQYFNGSGITYYATIYKKKKNFWTLYRKISDK